MGLKNVPDHDALSCGFVLSHGDRASSGLQVSAHFAGTDPMGAQSGGAFARLLVGPVDGARKVPGVIHSWGQG